MVMTDMAENDAPRTVEQIASEIADSVYPLGGVHRMDLYLLLVEFAEEIQRRSIEP